VKENITTWALGEHMGGQASVLLSPVVSGVGISGKSFPMLIALFHWKSRACVPLVLRARCRRDSSNDARVFAIWSS